MKMEHTKPNNVKISIYLKNITESPSAYYCITQYVKKIDNFQGHINGLWPDKLFRLFMKPLFRRGFGNILRKGILFLIQCLNAIRFMVRDVYIYKPHTVVICRELFPQKMPGCFSKLYTKLLETRKVIWSFDDNIIAANEISHKEWDILCKYSDEIMVTHDFLKNTLPKHLQKKVSYIPQADGDIDRKMVEHLKLGRESTYDKEIHLIWVATAANLPNMYHISEGLEKAATLLKKMHQKDLILDVVCNMPYEANHTDLKVNNIVWTRERAAQQITLSHIGIMPLIDNEYTRGKGGFKLVQYMTADLPVLASNVGYNTFVVGNEAGIIIDDSKNLSEWVNAILLLSSDKDIWKRMGEAANKRCQEHFSFEKNLLFWKKKLGY